MALIMTSPLVLAEETATTPDRRALSPSELDSVKGGVANAASASSGTAQQNATSQPSQQESSVTSPAITDLSGLL
jgi:hypothetical protein